MSVALPVNEAANYNQAAASQGFAPTDISSIVGLFDSRVGIMDAGGLVFEWADGAGVGAATEGVFLPAINTETIGGNAVVDFQSAKMEMTARSVRSVAALLRLESSALSLASTGSGLALQIQPSTLSFDGSGTDTGTYVIDGDDTSIPANAENHAISKTTNDIVILYAEWDALKAGIDLIGGFTASTRGSGQLAGLAMFNAPLSTGDRQSMEGYWAHQFGQTGFLPVGHPYKTDAP